MNSSDHKTVRTNYTEPMVSVAIVNYNGKDILESCLSSVLNCCYRNFEVILYDNGSTDGSIKLVKELFAHNHRLKIVEGLENLGAAEGRNYAINFSCGEIVCLLHSDTVVDSNWLAELVRVMEGDKSIGAAQCKILLFNYPDRFDSAGVIMDAHGCSISIGKVTGFLKVPSDPTFDISTCETDRGQYDRMDEIFATTFTATAVRRNVLSEVGFFDSEFFGYLEDVDLSWRIRLGGYKIVRVPTAIVYHRGGATTTKKELWNSMAVTFSKNRLVMLIKNYSFTTLLKVIPALLGWYLTIMLYCMVFDRKLFLPYTTGLLQSLADMKNILRKRMEVQRNRRTADKEIFKHITKGCVTIDYKLRPWIRSKLGG